MCISEGVGYEDVYISRCVRSPPCAASPLLLPLQVLRHHWNPPRCLRSRNDLLESESVTPELGVGAVLSGNVHLLVLLFVPLLVVLPPVLSSLSTSMKNLSGRTVLIAIGSGWMRIRPPSFERSRIILDEDDGQTLENVPGSLGLGSLRVGCHPPCLACHGLYGLLRLGVYPGATPRTSPPPAG